MVYGQIEEASRSDAPGAALIRRLQLPLLRVALQDRAFFVRGNHPARRLLNTVDESAAKWLDEDDYDPQKLLPRKQACTHGDRKYAGEDAGFDSRKRKRQNPQQALVPKAELPARQTYEDQRVDEKHQA